MSVFSTNPYASFLIIFCSFALLVGFILFRKFYLSEKQEGEAMPRSQRNLSDNELLEVKKKARRVMADIKRKQFTTLK